MKIYIFLVMGLMLTGMCCAQKQLKLENENVKAVFDPANGSLISFVNKKTGWNIVNRKQLGQSFEMLVPLEGRRFHNVRGVEQASPKTETTANRIVFTWETLRSDHLNRKMNITFKGTVTLTDDGLTYSGEVINNDAFTIEYIGWPYLGEVTLPDKKKGLVCQSRNGTRELAPMFNNEHGYWGVDYPTQFCMLPENSFMLIRNEDQGMYVSTEQVMPSKMLLGTFELIPGYDVRNPEGDEMDGQLVRIQFKANHVVYVLPRTRAVLEPVLLSLYKGTWHEGADKYKQWRNACYTSPASPGWLAQPLTWQKVSVSQADELITYAQEAKKYGVSVLQVSGWARDGKEKRVGMIDGLAAAIQKCQALGVRVVLEANFTHVDFRSDWYKRELKEYVIEDPFGFPYNRHLLCPLVTDFRRNVLKEAEQNEAILKADGVLCNDNDHQSKTYFCFDPGHGHKVPEFTASGSLQLDQDFAGVLRKNHPDAALLGYGFYDTQSMFYNGYEANGNSPMQRYLDTDLPLISTMDVRSARRDMNLSVKNRYNICYDLRFDSNQLKTYPQIMDYGQKLEALRSKYADLIWNGEFNDTRGAGVTGKDVSYAVFKRKSDGKSGVVVVNQGEKDPSSITVTIRSKSVPLVMATPENPEAVPCNGAVVVPPQSLVIVMEK